MNPYAFPNFIGALFSIFIGLFVLNKDSKSKLYWSFFFLTLSVAIWQLGTFFMLISDQKNSAFILTKFVYLGAIFIPVTTYHVAVNFLSLDAKRNKVFIFYFLAVVIFIPLTLFNQLISDVYRFLGGYWFKAGKYHPLFLIFFGYLMCLSFIKLYSHLKKIDSAIKRTQIKYLFVALSIGYLGAIDYLPNYGFKIYPIGYLPVILCIMIIAYAIVKHNLMDIEVIIKKSLVFAGMFIFAFGVFVAIALLIPQLIAGGKFISLAISSLIIVMGLRPLETILINSTDRFLFQKKYEYKQVLKKFIDEIITVLNLDEIVSSTLKLLDQTLHPYTAAIFILNKVEDRYQLYNSQGLDDKDTIFSSESKLIAFLKKSHNLAIIKQIDGIAGVNQQVASEMSQLKAVLVYPLLLHNDLIGFISLGRKKSDEEYTKDDLDVLLDLARTESIAVGNAQLLQEAAQAERSAAIGTMAAGIHHEIGNPLNIINTKIQVFLVGIKRGLYKEQTKEEIIQESESILNETLKQTNRISEITRKLANFAKPSKEFKPELISISEEIDETLAVVAHELELERIKLERQISSDLPMILADRREIQQIFFNLIRNAAQAIEEAGTITISAVSRDDNKVHIEIRDTGKGIPEDKIHRIFEPFFTTKGPNKGTGLGLSIVRQLVWRNKGEISFKSRIGIGTTFILEFSKGV